MPGFYASEGQEGTRKLEHARKTFGWILGEAALHDGTKRRWNVR